MSIFNFTEEQSLGEVRSVETSRITVRVTDGQRKNTFTRAVFSLPEINRLVFPIEEKSLEDFMGILSASSKTDAVAPLKVGTYTLDGKASAYIDGDKLFQKHAALLGRGRLRKRKIKHAKA